MVKWFYKFFDESLKEETNVAIFEEEVSATIHKLAASKYFPRTENKNMCRYCEFVDICKVRGI